jgi:hypothetical protein
MVGEEGGGLARQRRRKADTGPGMASAGGRRATRPCYVAGARQGSPVAAKWSLSSSFGRRGSKTV